jgi:hypothetical protein
VILDRSHKKWAIVCAALAILACGLYALNACLVFPLESSGSGLAGLWFGIAGTVLLAFAGLLPLRKWYPLARIGSAQSWLRAHIWLSLLGSLLILLHSAFQWRGVIELWLMLLLALLVASGLWGLVAQSLLTRQLSLQVPLETFYENLPQACRMLQFEGDVLLARLCDEPLPLSADETIVTDERLKNRGIPGRDYAARLAKVYAPAAATAAPAVDVSPALPPAAAPPPAAAEPASPEPTGKPLSAAEKIALMRAKRSAAAAAPPEPAAAAQAPAPAESAEPKALSTAEKLKLMRSKKAAPAEAAPVAAERPVPAVAPAPPRPLPARTIPPEALQPFQRELREFFLESVRPFLALDRKGADGGLHSDATATIVFARMAAALPAELHAALEQLESLCAQRRQVSTQTRLYHWLHGWLVLVHIPAAAALAALVVVHIVASLYW